MLQRRRWFTPTFRASSPLTMEWVGGMIAGTSVAGYGHACEAISRLDNASALPTIGCPTLVIAGSEDGAAPPAALEAMARAIPNARLATLPAAHLANVEVPTAYAELVRSFLDDTND